MVSKKVSGFFFKGKWVHFEFVSSMFLRHFCSPDSVFSWYGLLLWGKEPNQFKWNVQIQSKIFTSLITAFDSLLDVFLWRIRKYVLFPLVVFLGALTKLCQKRRGMGTSYFLLPSKSYFFLRTGHLL